MSDHPAGSIPHPPNSPFAKAAVETGPQRYIKAAAGATSDGKKVVILCLDDGSRIGVYKEQWEVIRHTAEKMFK